MKLDTPPIPSCPPSYWRDRGRYSLRRLVQWTARRRYHEWLARRTQAPLADFFRRASAIVETSMGEPMNHTAVTSTQLAQLLLAIDRSNDLQQPVIEIGSFRGITTRAMASRTDRQVVAVDPYVGDGGHPKDLRFFEEHTDGLSNVQLLREPSDIGFSKWGSKPISLVFIDAIHEYVHAWYDFAAWGSLVVPGGFVAFHDVDQFPGVNRVCQRILRDLPQWKPWAFVPNLAIFQRAK